MNKTTFAHGYALLIGVHQHQVARWSLPAVEHDIAALAQTLIDPQRCAYLPEHVKTLTGADATRAAIQEGLDWLQTCINNDASGNATAVVYYSGHGWRDTTTDPPSYYLIPYDVPENRVATRALRAADFAGEIAALTAQRVFVVLDCCHAGGMGIKQPGASQPEIPQPFAPAAVPAADFVGAATVSDAKSLSALQTGAGRAVLSSSQGEQPSYVRSDGQMSIFTYHLIEALTGHAQPQGGAPEVLVSDVLSYVHRHVPATARQESNVAQQPHFEVSGNFPVALVLGGKGLAAGEAPPAPPTPQPGTQITNVGSGAVAHGEGATAAGAGGVAIGGNVSGSNITTGDNNTVNQVDTGGGAYVGGNVSTGGGEFVGRDQVVRGDNVQGDKVRTHIERQENRTTFDQRGQTVGGNQTNIDGDVNTRGGMFNTGNTSGGMFSMGNVDNMVIYQGGTIDASPRSVGPMSSHQLIEEPIRLDVAAPKTACVDEPFELAVSVRQPDAEPLTFDDLEQVASDEGRLFRTTEDEVVAYRIEIIAADCTAVPQFYKIRLRPNHNSLPCFFQITPTKPGRRSIVISAYQDDDSLVAQTRIRIKITVPVGDQ